MSELVEKQTSLISPEMEASVNELNILSKEAKGLETISDMTKSFATMNITKRIKAALNDQVVTEIMDNLMGEDYGFLTDKDWQSKDKQYSKVQIRKVLVQATMNGLQYYGKMFTVIGGTGHINKEGWEYKLSNIEGLEWDIEAGVPDLKPIPKITLMLNASFQGKAIARKLTFTVKPNLKKPDAQGFQKDITTADQVIGKGTAKAQRWLYKKITNSDMPDTDSDTKMTGDVDMIDVQGGEVETDQVAEQEQARASRAKAMVDHFAEKGITPDELQEYLIQQGIIEPSDKLEDLSDDVIGIISNSINKISMGISAMETKQKEEK